MANNFSRKTTGKKSGFSAGMSMSSGTSKSFSVGSCQHTGSSAVCDAPAAPTYEQIAARARAIWETKGCIPGQDEQNWLEAEAQLKAEMGCK